MLNRLWDSMKALFCGGAGIRTPVRSENQQTFYILSSADNLTFGLLAGLKSSETQPGVSVSPVSPRQDTGHSGIVDAFTNPPERIRISARG